MKLRPLPWLILATALLPALTFFFEFRDIPYFGSQRDDAVYVETGKALAAGQGYRMPHLPGQPPQLKYPPVLPVLIAAVWHFQPAFPDNLDAMAAINLLALAALGLALFRLFPMFGFTQVTSAAIAGIVCCLPGYIYLASSVMTEILCVALLTWAFVLLEKSETGSAWTAAGAGLVAAIAYLTRGAAAPLMITAPLCLLLNKRPRHAAAFAAAAAPPAILWQIWCALHKVEAHDWLTRFYLSYGDMERFTIGADNVTFVVYQNIDSILTNLGETVIFGLGHSSAWGHQAARLIGVAAVAGSVRLAFRARRWHCPAFSFAFAVMMMFWHYPPEERLIAPLAPLCVAGLFAEGQHLWSLALATLRKGKLPDRIVAAGFASALAAFGLFTVYSLADARLVQLPALGRDARAALVEQRAAFAQVARLTAPRSVILSDQDALLSLYTGRTTYRTIVPPRLFYPMQPDRVRAAFAEMPDAAATRWDYLLLTGGDWTHALDGPNCDLVRAAIGQHPGLDPLWRSASAALYFRKPPAVPLISQTR